MPIMTVDLVRSIVREELAKAQSEDSGQANTPAQDHLHEILGKIERQQRISKSGHLGTRRFIC